MKSQSNSQWALMQSDAVKTNTDVKHILTKVILQHAGHPTMMWNDIRKDYANVPRLTACYSIIDNLQVPITQLS